MRLVRVKILPKAGSIPTELGNLSKLKGLFLYGNKLSGELMLLVLCRSRTGAARGPWLTYTEYVWVVGLQGGF